MSKYIIKNCPEYNYGLCSSPSITEQGCVYCTNCVMKQIVEECKKHLGSSNIPLRILTNEFLQLLDVQEVE